MRDRFFFLIILILFIFSTNVLAADLISAADRESVIVEIDKITASTSNVKVYDSVNKIATIKNPTATTTYANIKLLTPLKMQVRAGYQKVAEFEIDSKVTYTDFLKQMYFFDTKNKNTPVKRGFDLKKEVIKQVEEPVYEIVESAEKDKNGDTLYEQKQIGTEIRNVTEYELLSEKNFDVEKQKVSIWTNVEIGDSIEWIPELYGAVINEWATWDYNTDLDLIAYYNMNETTGTTAIDIKGHDSNGTNTNVILGQTGKLISDYNYSTGTSSVTDLGSETPFDQGTGSFSVAMWFKTPVSSQQSLAAHALMANGGTNRDGWYMYIGSDFAGKAQFQFNLSANTSDIHNIYSDNNVADNQWHFIVADYNGTHMLMYIDGVLQGTPFLSGSPRDVANQKTSIGNAYYQGSYGNLQNFKGAIDEVSFWGESLSATDVNNLYSAGVGLTYCPRTDDFQEICAPSPKSYITWNVFRKATSINLTGVSVDCNVNAMDASTQDSPFASGVVDTNTVATCNFTRTGYDANNGVVVVVDSNKTVTVTLTDSTAPSVGATTLTGSGFTVYSTYFKGTGKIIGGTATDTGSGINTASCYVQYFAAGSWFSGTWNTDHCESDPFTAADTTVYTMNTRVSDAAGNLGTGTATAAYTADSSPPTSTLTFTDVNQFTKRFQIACSDVGSGCKKTYYTIDDGTQLNGTPLIDYYNTFTTTGSHHIDYFSSDNLDTNEVTKTFTFDINGKMTVRIKDENTGLDLNGATLNLNGLDFIINNPTLIDLNYLAGTSTNYLITISKTGYGTRYYQFDGNKYSLFDLNFLLLATSLGANLNYAIYDTNGINTINSTYFEMKRVNLSNWSIGRLKTSATGTLTIFTNIFDQNYSQLIGDINTYSMINLSVLYPKNEDTLIQISELWKIDSSGSGYKTYTDLNTTKNIYLIPNLVTPYQIKISDVNGNYFPRTYDQQYYGNPLTATLQPYLINTTTGLLVTIRAVSAYTNQPINNITIKIYRNIPGLGRTYVEQVVTDAKGEAITYSVLGATYEYEIYSGATLIRTDAITTTSATVYIKIDDLVYTNPILQAGLFNVLFNPGNNKLGLTDNNLIQTIYLFDFNSDVNIQNIWIKVLNTSINGTDGNDAYIYILTIPYNDENTIVNWIDINALTQDLNGVDYDTNGYIKVEVIIGTSDGNYTAVQYYKPYTGLDPIYQIGEGTRNMFGCTSGNDAFGNLLPCANQLFLALILTFIITCAMSWQLGFTNPSGLALIFLGVLGFFTFLTWVPIILYALLCTGTIIIIMVGRSRFA